MNDFNTKLYRNERILEVTDFYTEQHLCLEMSSSELEEMDQASRSKMSPMLLCREALSNKSEWKHPHFFLTPSAWHQDDQNLSLKAAHSGNCIPCVRAHVAMDSMVILYNTLCSQEASQSTTKTSFRRNYFFTE